MEANNIFMADETGMQPDWSRWENHVLSELKRLNGNIEKALVGHEDLTSKYFDMKSDITVIKTKIGLYSLGFGIIGSFIGSIIIVLIQWALPQ